MPKIVKKSWRSGLAVLSYYENQTVKLPLSPNRHTENTEDTEGTEDTEDTEDTEGIKGIKGIDLSKVSIYRYRRAKPRRSTVMVSGAEPHHTTPLNPLQQTSASPYSH